ncbi:hypothetical protein BVRB_7g158060 [Beta vulgaris subsp. vulgaris]|nr:hypothetical protein BVRB_7g158060 [Beta vulgaris subsp. vulgaris]
MQQPEKRGDETLPRPPRNDVEGGAAGVTTPESNSQGSLDLKKWKWDWMKKWVLILRACVLAFTFIAFILMASVGDFYLYAGPSYLLGVAIIVTLYSAVQVGIKGHELRTKKDVISPKIVAWIDLCGDQFLAYMLFSSSSAGAAISIGLKSELLTNVGLELMAASVSMSIFAFFCMAPIALFSSCRFFSN